MAGQAQPAPADEREQAIGRVTAELARHAAPRFTDEDGGDTGCLNCKCGLRIPPTEGPASHRDWAAYDRHVAGAVLDAMKEPS